jgi:hypothetical protein
MFKYLINKIGEVRLWGIITFWGYLCLRIKRR